MKQRLLILAFMLLPSIASAEGALEAVEAASSCVVTHKASAPNADDSVTCFENISLERTSFESGVCQWKTDAQADAQVETTTTFVPHCPPTYSAYCDRLVMGPAIVAPVKIFLYDRAEAVLKLAKRQCLSGGGNWHTRGGQPD